MFIAGARETPVIAADAARRKAVERKLTTIWKEVNKRWRDHGQKRVTQVEVDPITLKPLAPPEGFTFPPSAHNVVARDGIYYRDGRLTFLFGVEGRMYDGAWINRILRLDFFSYGMRPKLVSNRFLCETKAASITAAKVTGRRFSALPFDNIGQHVDPVGNIAEGQPHSDNQQACCHFVNQVQPLVHIDDRFTQIQTVG